MSPTGAAPARLWLLQDGVSLIGWYETGLTSIDPARAAGGLPARLEDVAGAAATAPLWMVDGDVRGAVVRLTQFAGDGLRLPRTLVLDGTGVRLSGPWPLGFGPPETEYSPAGLPALTLRRKPVRAQVSYPLLESSSAGYTRRYRSRAR